MRDLRGLALLALIGCAACSQPSPPAAASNAPALRPEASGAERRTRTITLTPDNVSEEPWSLGHAQGAVVRTEHYRLFSTIESSQARRRVALFLERALTHYRGAIVRLPPPPMRLDTYCMANREQWETVTRRLMDPAIASTILQIGRGGFASRGIGVYWDIGLRDTLALAAHEGWHQYTQRTFAHSMPAWLEEGLATYMEGHRWNGAEVEFLPWSNLERFDRLRSAASSGSLLTLERLLDSSPAEFLKSGSESGLTYYAQVWALVHFLASPRSGHREELEGLLLDSAGGLFRRRVALVADSARLGLGKSTYLAYFNSDLGIEERRFRDFVSQIVATGSRERIAVGLPPL